MPYITDSAMEKAIADNTHRPRQHTGQTPTSSPAGSAVLGLAIIAVLAIAAMTSQKAGR